MTTLAIDTSTPRGSVAVLAGDGTLLLEENFRADRSHSASLFAGLTRARAVAPHFDRIAVGLGPGSYAGIRIAIAAAIGMELALGAELVGLPSVAALETMEPRYIAIGDARRETFYWTRVEDGLCAEGPELLTESALRERLAANALPVFVPELLPPVPAALVALPHAATLARLAAANRGIITGPLEPIYLREPHITQPRKAPPSLPS